MIAADRLVPTFQPSFKHLTTILARRHPRTMTWLNRYSEEIFFGLSFALESHYLRAYDGSFGENFYGLKRIRTLLHTTPTTAAPSSSSSSSSTLAAVSPLSPTQHSSLLFSAESVQSAMKPSTPDTPPGHSLYFRPLSSHDRRRALFFLCILPYMRRKMEQLYIRWRDGMDEDGFEQIYDPAQHSSMYNLFRRLFMHLYPYSHSLIEGTQFVYGLRYLFDRSVYYSTWFGLMSQVARRMNMEEMMAAPRTETQAIVDTGVHTGMIGLLTRALSSTGTWISRYAKYMILLAIFGFKFLEWWHSPANSYYNADSTSLSSRSSRWPIPPPPKIPPRHVTGIPLLDDSTLCSLCQQDRINPAATPTGYVFCYACIHAHITTHKNCPVTLRPCRVEEIRKIYEN